MGEATYCLINPAAALRNNCLKVIWFTTESINKSDCDYRPKHCALTSLAATRLKNTITVVSRNHGDAVLIPLDAESLQS